jgi:hypothetical protein
MPIEKIKFTLTVLLFLFSFSGLKAQSIIDYQLKGNESGKSLETVFQEIQNETNARFFYLPEWIMDFNFDRNFEGKTLKDALDYIFEGTNLSYKNVYNHAIVIVKDPTQALSRRNSIALAMSQEKKVKQYKFGEIGKSKKVAKVVISGKITESGSDEALPFAIVQVSSSSNVITADGNGNYKLELSPGPNVLNFSFIDHDNFIVDLIAYEDGVVDVAMDKVSVELEEVVIEGRADQELATSRIGQTQIIISDIKRAPAFLGEVDLIKQIQNLPGVTSVGEAATGFNVRGGSVDQNLVLYDGMPVFNSSHVFGFFSAFNSEAVDDVSFFRGGIPAEYGGRVSSVLDIKSKDGNYEKWSGKAGIGMITSNVMVNGPLEKGKTALAASLRSTYSNWLMRSIKTDYANLKESKVSFYDATLKLTHLVSPDTKLSFTGYSSRDGFSLEGDTTYNWQNLQLSGKVDHQFSPILGAEFIAGVTSYGYNVENDVQRTESELRFSIRTTVLKAGFNLQHGSHALNFGWNMMHYRFNPGQLTPTSANSNSRDFAIDKQYSIENAFYFSDAWQVNSQVFVEAGLRVPLFMAFGPADVYQYEAGLPIERNNITDTVSYGKFRPTKSYLGFEPRVSFRYMLSGTSSLKFGYNRMYQFLHLVTNTTAVTPIDIWQPSGPYFKPQIANQISLGYFQDFEDKKYGFSTEGFYKTLGNIVDFKDGAQLILNNTIEADLLQGTGRAYGIETSIYKNKGRLTGTINYTYSRSFRTVNGPSPSEKINRGKEYPSNFDQPHIFNLSWKYNITKRHYFTGNFTYHTGRPVTIPLSGFLFENTNVAYFSTRNQYRIPDYHRMDVALVIEGNHKRRKWAEGTWVISLYNAYGRKNPYSIFFKSSRNGVPEPYQLSIVGTVLPSISYNLKF